MATSLPSFSQAFSSMSAPRKRTRDDDHDNPKKRRVVTVVGIPHDSDNNNPEHPPPPILPAKHKQKANSRPAQSLPFPAPNSFAQRRTGFKPADIVISPRDDGVEPAIQSAPPVPQGMAIPRLPPVIRQADNPRTVASKVPPTPARLSRLRQGLCTSPPPAPSIAIASTLVPTTPAVLHHQGYSGDKSAFLAPFELFYDALNDSKQLKAWLSQQLQQSQAFIQSCSQFQDKLNDTIEAAVDKRVSAMTAELVTLRHRVDELEDALLTRRPSTDASLSLPKHKQLPLWNGSASLEPYAYSSPSLRRRPSPTWIPDRDSRGNPGDSERHVSPPYDSRRLATISATRLDPPHIRDPAGRPELTRSLSHTDPALPIGPLTPSSASPRQQPSLNPSSSSSSSSSPSSQRPASRRNSID